MVEGKPDNKDHLKEHPEAIGEEPAGSTPPAREAQYIEETEQVGRDVDQAADQVDGDQANAAAAAAADAEAAPSEPEQAAPAVADKAAAEKAAEPAAPRGSSPILPLLSGAVGAALVLGGAWFAVGQNLPLTPQSGDSAALETLTARIASVEAKANAAASAPAVASAAAPAASEPDPALIKRIDNLEKSVTALHDELAATKDKAVQLSAAIGNLKTAAPSDAAPAEPSTAEAAAPATPSVPAATAAELAELGERLTKLQAAVAALPPPPAPVDLAPVNERLSKLEVAVDKPPPVLDDSGLRRVVAAALLESAVQHGEGYAGLLGTAKSLTPDPAALQPLEPFAANGVPSAKDLCRELIALLPKLIPGYDPLDSTASILDRLQAGADRLVRIQRPGTPGTKDRSAVLARMITAAQRNDLAEAKRELSALEPSERAPAQEWLNRANARDAALSASRQFAAAAMAALSK